MSTLLATALDYLDRSVILLYSPYLWGAVALVLAYLGYKLVLSTWWGASEESAGKSSKSKSYVYKTSSESRLRNRSKFLIRESARLISLALEQRQANLLSAYENAVYASVLARTAKEVDDDTARLSNELGVDYHEYLSYTTTVLHELQTQLTGRV